VYWERDSVLARGSGLFMDYIAGGTPAVAVRGRTTATTLLEFGFHEAFHGFQERVFTGREGSEIVPDELIRNTAFIAATERERTMLVRLLSSPASPRCAMASDFLAARGRRLSDTSIARIESQIERSEGTAQLISAAVVAAGERAAADIVMRDSIISLLQRPLSAYPSGMNRTWPLMRWRLYGTGAALGLVLDSLDSDWKKKVESGRSLDSVLAAAVQLCALVNPEQRRP